MKTINKEDIKPDTSIKVLYKFLTDNIEDKHPRKRVDDFELGTQVGKLELLDLIRRLAGE